MSVRLPALFDYESLIDSFFRVEANKEKAHELTKRLIDSLDSFIVNTNTWTPIHSHSFNFIDETESLRHLIPNELLTDSVEILIKRCSKSGCHYCSSINVKNLPCHLIYPCHPSFPLSSLAHENVLSRITTHSIHFENPTGSNPQYVIKFQIKALCLNCCRELFNDKNAELRVKCYHTLFDEEIETVGHLLNSLCSSFENIEIFDIKNDYFTDTTDSVVNHWLYELLILLQGPNPSNSLNLLIVDYIDLIACHPSDNAFIEHEEYILNNPDQ